MTDTKLLPCEYCGSRDIVVGEVVQCNKCGHTAPDAADWNRRTKEAAAEPPATLSAEERAEFFSLLDQCGKRDQRYLLSHVESLIAARLATAPGVLADAKRWDMFRRRVEGKTIVRRETKPWEPQTWKELTAYLDAEIAADPHGYFDGERLWPILNAARTASTTGTVERPRDTGPGHAQE